MYNGADTLNRASYAKMPQIVFDACFDPFELGFDTSDKFTAKEPRLKRFQAGYKPLNCRISLKTRFLG